MPKLGEYSKEFIESFEELMQVEWNGKSPKDSGFDKMSVPTLERKDSSANRYLVVNQDGEEKLVDATTVIEAIEVSGFDNPIKVEHANCRIGHLLEEDKLQRDEKSKSSESDKADNNQQ